MQIKLKDGTTLALLSCNGSSRHIQGATRDSLEFQLASGESTLEELDALFTAENCDTLTIIDGESQFVHNHYVVRAELAVKPVVITPGTPEAPEITENRVSIVMAQLTYSELQAKRNAQDILDLNDAVAALAFGGIE